MSVSADAARAMRMGINLGRLIAVEVAMDRLASDPMAGWRFVEPYRGIHQRLYRRAIDRAADAEGRRIIDLFFDAEYRS